MFCSRHAHFHSDGVRGRYRVAAEEPLRSAPQFTKRAAKVPGTTTQWEFSLTTQTVRDKPQLAYRQTTNITTGL